MNQNLIDFEQHANLAPKEAALVLGVGYSTYAHYRSGLRVLPPYHEKHVRALMALSGRALRQLIEDELNG